MFSSNVCALDSEPLMLCPNGEDGTCGSNNMNVGRNIGTLAAQYVTLSGCQPNEVLDVVRQRARSGSRADGHRVALVVEGGSMRGVYTAGSLVALHIMGLWDLFDNAYGASAGAANIAQFLSGMGDVKADSYYRVLADGRFYNPHRVSKIVDIDFFADEVLTKLRPVEVDRVMASPTPFWVSVADFVTARTVLFHAQAGDLPLLQLLKAATAMPIFYNRLIDLGGVRGFDAGFTNPFPLLEALAHENTHVLVLLAAPEGYTSPALTARELTLIASRFARGNRQVGRMFEEAASSCDRLRDLAHGRTRSPFDSKIATIAPVSASVGMTTQDPELLRSALLETARGTLRLLGHPEDRLDELMHAGKL
jgi:predicted patatin/cPLA2 family phospholipase